jgi:arylsulfatase A-like enzyme
MPACKSLILVTVDCLRADHCGFMGYTRPTTPFLDTLANESFVVPTAIAVGVPTYYSLPAIMASRYPLALGREIIGLAPEEKTLATVCKENGYATAFFGAGNPYLSARYGYDAGFDTFRDFLDDLAPASAPQMSSPQEPGFLRNLNRFLAAASQKIPGVRVAYDELYFRYCLRRTAPAHSFDTLRRFPAADVIIDQARAWLASIGKVPFFLWIHLMDPHSPYYPTEKGLELFGEPLLTTSRVRFLNACWNRTDITTQRLRRHRKEIIALYDSAIRWVDAQLSRLIATLRQFNLWENCIFALTADHGEEFLEHDRRYHAPSLVKELTHVPLLLRVPGTKKTAVCKNPFSLLHLPPTLLSAAGLPIPQEFQGQSRWNHLQQGTAWNDFAISECISGCTNPFSMKQRCGPRLLAIREEKYKLVLNFQNGSESFFDLEADPAERSPLTSGEAKYHRRRLLQAALLHLQSAGKRQSSLAYLRARLRDIEINSEQNSDRVSAGVLG